MGQTTQSLAFLSLATSRQPVNFGERCEIKDKKLTYLGHSVFQGDHQGRLFDFCQTLRSRFLGLGNVAHSYCLNMLLVEEHFQCRAIPGAAILLCNTPSTNEALTGNIGISVEQVNELPIGILADVVFLAVRYARPLDRAYQTLDRMPARIC